MFVAAICVMIAISGCGPTTTLVRERPLAANEVLKRVQNHDENIRTVKGAGTVTIESPESSGSGSFTTNVRKPDSLKVQLSGPFGIRIGTLVLTREEVLYYDWRENTATIGTSDAQTLQSMIRIKLRFDEILRAFTGEFLSITSRDTLSAFSVEEGLYVLRYRSEEGTKEFRVDGDTFIVTSYRLLDNDGSASLVAFASRFDEISNITVPTLLRVILPKERRSLTIAYNDLHLNNEVQCSFTVPQQADIIRR